MRAGNRTTSARTAVGAVTVVLLLALTAVPAAAFDDVPPEHAFYDEITWLSDNGIATGFDDGTFRPTAPVSRQAMAGFLQRTYVGLGGVLEPSYPDPGFSDVSPTNPFYDEISWMVDTGFAYGFADGTFRPTTPVSRQVMTSLLYRLWVELGAMPEVSYPDPGFSDVTPFPPFGHPIWWSAHEEIAGGFPDGTFRPTLAVSRQAMAAFVQRFDAVARQIGEPDFVVDTATDAVDALPGDGACVAVGGGCTLRAAIGESNTLFGRQIVGLAVDPVLSLTGPEPTPDNAVNDVDVTADLEIQGDGHNIAGAGLEVGSGSVAIDQLNVPLGIGNGGTLEVTDSSTGGLYSSGGDLSVERSTFPNGNVWIEQGTATIVQSLIEAGTAAGEVLGGGGGIHIEDAEVRLVDSEVRDNVSQYAGGGIQAIDSSLSIVDSEITDNRIECDTDCTTGPGGGLHLVQTHLVMTGSTVSGNHANGYGGGIHITGGTASITRSTIEGNTAGDGGEVGTGGGISVWAFADVAVALSTISGNVTDDTTDGLGGAGVHVASGMVDLVGSTVAENSALAGAPVPQQLLAMRAFAAQPAAITLHGTIVSGSVGGAACLAGVDAPITSLGHNLASDGSCALTLGTDQPSTDPQLGPLAGNGGPTLTHLPGPTSPVLDHIPSGMVGLCAGETFATDQRGVVRPQGGSCDIGAVERAVP